VDLLTLDLPDIPKLASGKVREIFDLGERLLFVATDRISAFDCILPNAIPQKGAVLTQLSAFWFRQMGFVPNHLVTAAFAEFPSRLERYERELRGRSCIVRKATPLPVECVVRGYLAGSGWKEYQASGTVCGIRLRARLRPADRLETPIFTPATKAVTGHDENIAWDRCCEILGHDMAKRVRELSLRIYSEGRDYAAERGIILADTKFEFGTLPNGEIVLIDECLTPDSSRFWPAAQYTVGQSPPSFDKQFVRDYLETLDWPKTPPAPSLPEEVVLRTSEKYLEAFERLTGSKLSTV
jgi:phosphoribosylaminoimidazole-succinocarboxamide synthase